MRIKNPIPYIFYLLFLTTPLIFAPVTSEIFEFNKITIVYAGTILILFFWTVHSILAKRIIFRRTMLDFAIAFLLISQGLSTLTSIDFRTSLLGYYSRFNGGLASTLSYAILYWAFVSFMDYSKTKKAVFFLLVSAIAVSVWGILEHAGFSFSCLLMRRQFTVDCWVQDVQNRVFASLGQPNWLAAFLVALLPISNFKFLISKQNLNSKTLNPKSLFWLLVSLLFFLTLLFTKSRSGLLGFLAADIIFWSFVLLKYKKQFLKEFVIHNSLFMILFLSIGNPFQVPNIEPQESSSAPALESGGTESGEIRQIVWKGALDIWKNYPIFGSGVETFAFSYYNFRPIEHNLTSEWDFTYNKAHNEYINYAATTGTVGLVAYLVLIMFSIYQMVINSKHEIRNTKQYLNSKKINFNLFRISGLKNWNLFRNSNFDIRILQIALLAGYISILVTNFFGFSVVTTSLLFFLFPAMATTLSNSEKRIAYSLKLKTENTQKFFILLVLFTMIYTLCAISRYWYTDTLYAKGISLTDSQQFQEAHDMLRKAIMYSPSEAIYWVALAESSKSIATTLAEAGKTQDAINWADKAAIQAGVGSELSPKNVNVKKRKYSLLTDLSMVDPSYLLAAREEIVDALKLAPTDAKLYYFLGTNSLYIKQTQEAIRAFEYAIEIKPNYENARLALASLYEDQGEKERAREQLEYILNNISPGNEVVKKELEGL